MNLPKEGIEKIKEYYKTCELWLPRYSQWRIWKVRIDNGTKRGRIIKIKDNIRDEATLRKWLLKLSPVLDVYYSSGCFLNPTTVKGNKTNNYLLFRDIAFDLDAEKPYGIEELDIVRNSTINLIYSLRKRLGQEPKYTIYTGGKGFQVIYEFEAKDIDLIEFLRIKGVDPEITTDRFRVIRCPLTVNRRGKVAIFLTEEDLNKGMNHILNKSKTIHSPLDLRDRAGRQKPMTILPTQDSKGRGSGTAPTDSTRAIYITNEVKGTKRYIPILKYDYKIINPKEQLQKLSDKYGLNEWFLIKTSGFATCISLAALDKRRLSKVLNSSKSLTKDEFKKFTKIFMRVSAYEGGLDAPTPVGVLYLKTKKSKNFLYSRPHSDMLEHFNFVSNPFMEYIGYDKPKILEVCKR